MWLHDTDTLYDTRHTAITAVLLATWTWTAKRTNHWVLDRPELVHVS